MTPKQLNIFHRYQEALRLHLRGGPLASVEPARGMGDNALAAGFQTLDLAKLHVQTLVTELLPTLPPRKRPALMKQAALFFTVAITPVEKTPLSPREAALQKRFTETLSQRTVELATSNLKLSLEIIQRKDMEEALKSAEQHYGQLLKESDRLQEELRRLSRQLISVQEDERKRISRELHDVVAQSLMGINIHLATLKNEAAISSKGLDENIARTQMLVQHSVDTVHRFARELRPAMLDDLGLIPALHAFMKHFTTQTGIRTGLTAFAGVEQLDTEQRTTLYRVAQEALTNVSRHAHANRVEVSIQQLPEHVCMTVNDDGKSFSVQKVLHNNGGKRLGLLGMRERLEMVGGTFAVKSAPGEGTTVVAKIPLRKAPKIRNRRRQSVNPI